MYTYRMQRRLLPLALLLTALLAAPAALAKGASEATITGPGLDSPLTLPGEGREDGEALMEIADAAGFAAVLARTPSPLHGTRPKGTLGPKYTIAYEMPGPNNEVDTLVQDVYPYARPSPVTYTKPDQRFWTTEETRGGWYVASPRLREALVAAGLPKTPTSGGDETVGRGPTLVAVALAAVAALVVALLLVARRRPQTRTVTASRSAS